jgi:hypothetical protein
MDSISHEHAATQIAKDYAAGDTAERRRIAETCEEHGILAALVVLALPIAARQTQAPGRKRNKISGGTFTSVHSPVSLKSP